VQSDARILLVADDGVRLAAAEHALAAAGYRAVASYLNPFAAMAAAEMVDPQVIVVDLVAPYFDSGDFVVLFQDACRLDVPVLCAGPDEELGTRVTDLLDVASVDRRVRARAS